MFYKNTATIAFAGLTIRFNFPNVTNLPEELTSFLCESVLQPDVTYEIQLLEEPLCLENLTAVHNGGIKIYPYKGSWLRVYPAITADDGCQVALFLCSDNKYILYYPASRWDFYASELHILHLIAIEQVLIRHNAFLLHSSLVQLNNQGVLFSGPSCIGKSTQASLWQKHLDADILNGDRCIIRKMPDGFYGCGSPWAGTSKIYRRELVPLKGIFLLKQAPENSIRSVGADGFARLFNQSIVNTWDTAFVEKLSSLIIEVLTEIPVYELSCQPDEDAVRLAYHTLFEGGLSYGT